jgi:hypothetical protein
MIIKKIVLAMVAASALVAVAAHADSLMPDFSAVPAGWTTDRYDPSSFSNVGTYQGRSNVLGIGIGSSGNLAERAPAYQYSFYNTQGKGHDVNGGAGSVLAADLYIPESWRNASNGSVRTDMWGVMSNANAVSDYTIFGFSNYGGAARLRVYDGDTANGWVDIATAINFNAWTSLAIDFTGSSYVYSVNGAAVYTDNTIHGSTSFSRALMQAYNFADPSIANASVLPYVANWANAEVPEPGIIALFGLGLLGFAASRRKSAKSRNA